MPFTTDDSLRMAVTAIALLFLGQAFGAEYHVSVSGADANIGSREAPFRTISKAAQIAQPGDVITVHEGVYRERINPPRGGTSHDNRITYQAAPGERVEIKGSEIVTGWTQVQNETWEVVLPNSFFGDFNPYSDVLAGHWFQPQERTHHTGAVYLNGEWFREAATREAVLAPAGSNPLWYAEVTEENTVIQAQFPGVNPNTGLVEINVRKTVFFPEEPGRDFITVRGFILSQAATPWAAPTQKQMGLIGPHWSKGWIIEDNVIRHAMTVGLSLGIKDFGEFPGNVHGMNQLVKAASESGQWSREKVGGHIIRRNHISHCGAAGINGNMGGAFSLIEGNHISDIHVDCAFSGLEQGGIKLHGAVDTIIRGNVVCRSGYGKARAIWLDWLGQGAVIEGNIAYDNENTDLYVEVCHGPCLVANNIFLSSRSSVTTSRGTAYVHNYFGGSVLVSTTTRKTPWLEPHSTKIVDLMVNEPGDDRYINNIFAGQGPVLVAGWGGVEEADLPKLPYDMEGNLYLAGAQPPVVDAHPQVLPDVPPPFGLVHGAEGDTLQWTVDSVWRDGHPRKGVTADRLGLTRVGRLPYELPNGLPVRVDRDFMDQARNMANPMPGPFEKPGSGTIIP